ncbi:MAG: cell cycle protein, partial [Ginsengibacter sp.]
MSNSGAWFRNRKAERICLLLIGIIMGLLFWKLFTVLQRDFAEVDARIDNGTMINLNAGKPGEAMAGVLKNGMYFEDPKDIAFTAATVAAAKVPGSVIDNIGTLNKKQYFVNADEAFLKGGKSFKRRVELSRDLLGFSGSDSISFEREKKHPLNVPAQTNLDLGTDNISGIVKQGEQAAPGVLLRLRMLIPQDSINAAGGDDEKNIIQFKNGVRKTFI